MLKRVLLKSEAKLLTGLCSIPNQVALELKPVAATSDTTAAGAHRRAGGADGTVQLSKPVRETDQ